MTVPPSREPRVTPVATAPSLVRLTPFFGANVLFGAGLFAHAFLYNFYLDGLGYGEGGMGLAAASLTAGGLLALAPAGVAVDRWGPSRVYLAAVFLATAGLAAGAWVERPALVFAAAGLAGLGTASWRVAMGPLLMRAAAPPLRSRAFSWNVALLLGSGAVWTALAGSLSTGGSGGAASVGGIRAALLAGAVGTSLAAPAFFALRLPAPSADRPARGHPAHGGTSKPTARTALALPWDVTILVAAIFVWMLGAALVLPFFNLYFQRVQGLAVDRIGLIFALAQGLTALVVFGGGELAQRWGPRRAFGLWGAIFPLALLAIAMGPGVGLAVALFVIQGLPSPATNPLLDEIVLDTAPGHRQGAASSWRNGATEASGFVGAALGGFVLERSGFGPLLTLAALVAAVGAVLLWRGFKGPGASDHGGPVPWSSEDEPMRTRPPRS